jgi:hypothetical protein
MDSDAAYSEVLNGGEVDGGAVRSDSQIAVPADRSLDCDAKQRSHTCSIELTMEQTLAIDKV